MKNIDTHKTNPIEELRRMESPVTEQDWAAITSDRRYVRKFGRKPGLSPRGRAAVIAGAVALLVTVPILVKILGNNKMEDVVNAPVAVGTEVTATAPATAEATPATPAVPTSTSDTPAKVAATSHAAAHEGSTLAGVVAKRQASDKLLPVDEIPVLCSHKPAITRDDIMELPERSETALEPARNEAIHQIISCSPRVVSKSSVEEEDIAETDDAEVAKYESPAEEAPAPAAEEFFIPSAFTPNGDGLNDLFYVNANFEPRDYELSIFNRNGDLVFLARDIRAGWDGQVHGRTLMQGMYVYVIKYKDGQGNEQRKQGQILLVP